MVDFPIQQGLFRYDVNDHHAILGAPIDVSVQEIRQRYLKIAYLLHPDTTRFKAEAEKKRAIKLFSKLVNPAYEILLKETSRTEHLLVISQIAQSLSPEKDKITLANEDSQKLFSATQNLDLVYRQLLHPLANDLYSDLNTVFAKIACISELNLIYLIMKSGQSIAPKPQVLTPTVTARSKTDPKVNTTTVTPPPPAEAPKKETTTRLSPQEQYYRRAKEQYDRENYAEAIAELREVLKIDPKDSRAHCLLGLSYLKSNMATMAKVHINTAFELTPQDPTIILAKRELDKVIPPEKQTDSGKSKGGLFGGLFGNKKK